MCRPGLLAVIVAVCAREALFVDFMRGAVVWGASPGFMIMRQDFRYPKHIGECASDGKGLLFSIPLEVSPANNEGVHVGPRSGHVSECAAI
ncbi:hypothetical protein BDP81DRAFT_429663 [Colletotrichum phormii]|uniref:Secreted protein n=1 Tax=Colletotrichum phormii TaxID=359342 RepID=A0AAI9ZNT5_9PEZI|nr:uncharacterized protein BDP81DRAFT_429663 [Colletotrichum phormii]KAK1635416.1 hypothetical protein BDP81DRAFT_429663 [Colletotrichum phormii]